MMCINAFVLQNALELVQVLKSIYVMFKSHRRVGKKM